MSPTFDYQKALASIDEKLTTLTVTVSRLEVQVETHNKSIEALRNNSNSCTKIYMSWMERLVWAGLSLLVWYLTGTKL